MRLRSVLIFLLTANAFADEGKANLRIGHNLVTYRSASVSLPLGKDKSLTANQSSTLAYAGGWELYTSVEKWNFYAYPGQESSALVGGYSILSNLEAGLSLNINLSANSLAFGDTLKENTSV